MYRVLRYDWETYVLKNKCYEWDHNVSKQGCNTCGIFVKNYRGYV